MTVTKELIIPDSGDGNATVRYVAEDGLEEGIDNPRLRGRKLHRRAPVHYTDKEGIDNPRLRGRKLKLMILSFHANIRCFYSCLFLSID